MRAEKAIIALLTGAAGVTALVVNRIYPGVVPQGTAMPALAVDHVVSTELTTIDANAAFGLVQSRIQVTAIAGTYPELKALIEQVRIACNYQRGVLGGTRVVSIIRDTVGPDQRDDDRQLYAQSIDFQVTFQEP